MKIYSNEDNLKVISHSIKANMPILLVGETGVGKTTMIRELAIKDKKDLTRVNLNGQTGVEELVGKWLIEKGKTTWEDGVLTRSMKTGNWIVFDEINGALPEVLFTLNSLLDDDRKIMMAEKDGEVVHAHKEFRFFATMNPPDEYSGTKEMNKALISRFGSVIDVQPLPQPLEEELLCEFGDARQAKRLAKISAVLRDAKKDEKIFYFCSTRDLIAAQHLIKDGIEEPLALETAIVNKADPNERDEIRKMIEQALQMKIKTPFEKQTESLDREKKKAKVMQKDAKEAMDKAQTNLSNAQRDIENFLSELFEELCRRDKKKMKDMLQQFSDNQGDGGKNPSENGEPEESEGGGSDENNNSGEEKSDKGDGGSKGTGDSSGDEQQDSGSGEQGEQSKGGGSGTGKGSETDGDDQGGGGNGNKGKNPEPEKDSKVGEGKPDPSEVEATKTAAKLIKKHDLRAARKKLLGE